MSMGDLADSSYYDPMTGLPIGAQPPPPDPRQSLPLWARQADVMPQTPEPTSGMWPAPPQVQIGPPAPPDQANPLVPFSAYRALPPKRTAGVVMGELAAPSLDPLSLGLSVGGGPIARGAGALMGAVLDPSEAQAGKITALLKGIRAYHGSPHDFEKFDLSKIGTGEGAQAYGHGLYFAEKEGTAKAYREQLSGQPMLEGGIDPFKEMPWMGRTQKDLATWQIKNAIDAGMSGDEAVALAAQKLNDMGHGLTDSFKRQPYYDAANAIAELRGKKWESSPGHMYEVNINADPAHFLDWDKPLGGQSEAVRNAMLTKDASALSQRLRQVQEEKFALAADRLQPSNVMRDEKGWHQLARESDALQKQLNSAITENMTGQRAYNALSITQAPRFADLNVFSANKLREAGIPGIRYLDAGSRGAGQGSSNYVVFNPDIIHILRKYGLAGAAPAGMGALAAQDQYGNP